MVSNNFRQNPRRTIERRAKIRRANLFKFGSAEWQQMIQQEYMLWPKQERRIVERRHSPRRQNSRRVKNNGKVRMPRQTNNLHNLLTNEERDMLNELSRSDDLEK